MRAALAWSHQSTQHREFELRLVSALHWFWLQRAYYDEGRIWLEAALARSSEATAVLQANVLFAAGRLADDNSEVQTLWEASLHLFRDLGDIRAMAAVLNELAWHASNQGDYTTRLARSRESLTLCQDSEPTMHDIRLILVDPNVVLCHAFQNAFAELPNVEVVNGY